MKRSTLCSKCVIKLGLQDTKLEVCHPLNTCDIEGCTEWANHYVDLIKDKTTKYTIEVNTEVEILSNMTLTTNQIKDRLDGMFKKFSIQKIIKE